VPQRLAAIDVGSNTILLLVAEPNPAGGLAIIKEAEDQPRLGAGLGTTRRLSEAAMDRALQSLVRMRDLAATEGATRMDAVATAAVREAENGAEFLDRVRRAGIPLRLISPEVEAELAYLSAAHQFPGADATVVADIGGGSMELVGARKDRVVLRVSLPLGAVRLTELGLSPEALREYIRTRLSTVLPGAEWHDAQVVGSGGTFANLASMVLARRSHRSGDSIQGLRVNVGELEQVLSTLEVMSVEERRTVPGLRPERADIIVAGLTAADELLRLLQGREVAVNRYGLREGLLLEMIGRANYRVRDS
jgi:exopolyphosphatase / guanosine-5'-triphosphate,3'-diphosphate pyrophosphatase